MDHTKILTNIGDIKKMGCYNALCEIKKVPEHEKDLLLDDTVVLITWAEAIKIQFDMSIFQ